MTSNSHNVNNQKSKYPSDLRHALSSNVTAAVQTGHLLERATVFKHIDRDDCLLNKQYAISCLRFIALL